jgi:hypothetical protein
VTVPRHVTTSGHGPSRERDRVLLMRAASVALRLYNTATSCILYSTTAQASYPFDMMLSASPLYHHTLYSPTRPSPLAERPSNVPPRASMFAMTSRPPSEKQAIPQRSYKPNPVVQTREAATQRRRDMFFRRVQKERDDKKWQSRGEQVGSPFHYYGRI